jgi:hypothetical protein
MITSSGRIEVGIKPRYRLDLREFFIGVNEIVYGDLKSCVV